MIPFKISKHSDFHLNFFQIVGAWRNFTVVTKLIKIVRVYMVLGDAVSKLETFVWILNHISRSITLSLFTLKASYLVKWPISTWSFMWWCQFIDWLKFETRPSSLMNFGTANSHRRVHAWRGIMGNQGKISRKQGSKMYVFLHISVPISNLVTKHIQYAE